MKGADRAARRGPDGLPQRAQPDPQRRLVRPEGAVKAGHFSSGSLARELPEGGSMPEGKVSQRQVLLGRSSPAWRREEDGTEGLGRETIPQGAMGNSRPRRNPGKSR